MSCCCTTSIKCVTLAPERATQRPPAGQELTGSRGLAEVQLRSRFNGTSCIACLAALSLAAKARQLTSRSATMGAYKVR